MQEENEKKSAKHRIKLRVETREDSDMAKTQNILFQISYFFLFT